MLARFAPPSPTPAARARPTLDTVGSAVSLACAAHCVLLPLVVGLLPALGLARLLDERVEWLFLAFSGSIGASSLGPTAWRTRRSAAWWVAPASFAAGFGILLAVRAFEARLGPTRAAAGVVLGAGGVIAAHAQNHRRRRRARACAAPCCAAPPQIAVLRRPGSVVAPS